jgi:hypothetical protein
LIGIYYVFFAAAQALGGFLSGKFIQLLGLEKTLFSIAIITLLVGFAYLMFSTDKVNLKRMMSKLEGFR